MASIEELLIMSKRHIRKRRRMSISRERQLVHKSITTQGTSVYTRNTPDQGNSVGFLTLLIQNIPHVLEIIKENGIMQSTKIVISHPITEGDISTGTTMVIMVLCPCFASLRNTWLIIRRKINSNFRLNLMVIRTCFSLTLKTLLSFRQAWFNSKGVQVVGNTGMCREGYFVHINKYLRKSTFYIVLYIRIFGCCL